jgi:hypothetical protein
VVKKIVISNYDSFLNRSLKKSQLFHMSLNENIHYTKIVDLDNIYNFVVQIFFI